MKGKSIKLFLFSVFIFLFMFIIFGVIVFELIKPLDSCVTVSGIHSRVQNQDNYYILARADGAYYETYPSDDFATLFSFDDWECTNSLSGELLLSLEFAELWVIDFYSDGQAAAYNGYAGIGKKAYAYYNIPDYIANRVIDYLEENGIQHEFGDGTIGLGSFNH